MLSGAIRQREMWTPAPQNQGRSLPNFDQSLIKNRLLSDMSAIDFEAIDPHLTFAELASSQALNSAGQPIEYCYFIESGIASVVATSAEGHETEVGIVGRDGMIDVATILGVDRSPLRCFIQIAGSGYRIPARALVQARKASPAFQDQLSRYAYAYLIQVAHTALANASFGVEERLARWLLMCGDRVGDSEISLTHEFLSTMLNVRRAGVTLAVQSLEGAGFVKARRGALSIKDRPGLEHFARDAYAPFA